MITIEKINRVHEIKESKYRLEHTFVKHYIETEEEFIKGIENLCNTIGEENIISIQFLNGENREINSCIIACKE